MDTTEQLLAEWQQFKEKRQQLIAMEDRLRRELASLTQEPKVKALLEEKRRLKNSIPDLVISILIYRGEIEGRHFRLEIRRRALTDEYLQQELDARLRKRQERLGDLEELKAPKPILENEKRMVFELAGTIEEVEKLFQQMDAESERRREASEQVLSEAKEGIAAIDNHYRQIKHSLEEKIRQTQQERGECYTEEIEWATHSRAHLEWILKHGPAHKDDFVCRYKAKFPTDDLTDLIPPLPAATPTQPKENSLKKRHKRPSVLTHLVATEPAPPLPAWRFWATFSSEDPGQELPQEKGQFLQKLRTILVKAGLPSLPVELVYDKLRAVSAMTLAQRQLIKKIARGKGPEGLKIVRVGRKHRLFLSVDEKGRAIRFIPCRRREAYSNH